MRREGMTKVDATHKWVEEFNAFPERMIEMIIESEPDLFSEVTKPSVGDRVYLYEIPEELDTSEHSGVICRRIENPELYCVELNDGNCTYVTEADFEVERETYLPMWGTLWSFGSGCDDGWLEYDDGIRALSDCGFRVYLHEDFGYFFGIDGAGYDFYESHWVPLYDKRGLQWHREPQNEWYAETQWSVEDVIEAAEEQNLQITEEQAKKWWAANERSFRDTLVQTGNEILSNTCFTE